MRNAVEKGPDIKVKNPVLFPAAFPGYGQRVMGTSPGTITVAVAVEDRLQLLLQQHGDRRLRNPVRHIWDGRFILPLLQSRAGRTLVFWDRRWAGRALMVPGCRLALTFPGPQCGRRGLVLRAAGLSSRAIINSHRSGV